MKKINKYIQYFILGAAALIALSGIFNAEMLIWLLFIALPLGFTHYVGSLLDVILFGKSSTYLYHLIISTFVLLVIASITDLNILFRADGIYESFAEFIGYGGSVGLAVYFWVITFGSGDEVIVEHKDNLFDT